MSFLPGKGSGWKTDRLFKYCERRNNQSASGGIHESNRNATKLKRRVDVRADKNVKGIKFHYIIGTFQYLWPVELWQCDNSRFLIFSNAYNVQEVAKVQNNKRIIRVLRVIPTFLRPVFAACYFYVVTTSKLIAPPATGIDIRPGGVARTLWTAAYR